VSHRFDPPLHAPTFPPPPPRPEGIDPAAYAAFHAFVRAGHAHRQLLGTLVGETGGHPAQAGCLRVLAGHDGISQRDLAQMLFLTPPSVTTMLQRMERSGIIERRQDADDQRLTRVHLTDAGRALEGRVRDRMIGYMNRMFDGMSQADLVEFERLLRLMADNTTKAAE
jgi:MarR family transcriptional regulator, organic hydroperoxide resistance regulator